MLFRSNPKTRLLYIPLQQNLCTTLAGEAKIAPYAAGKRYVGTDASKTRVFPREGADHIGEVQAWDMDSGKLVWTYNFPDMNTNWGPLLTTGGGLVFGGDVAGNFRALDDKTGEVLWETNIGSPVSGYPVSFAVEGKQYVAVTTGPSLVAMASRRMTPELPGDAGAGRIVVFALP